MPAPDEHEILRALAEIVDPASGKDIVSAARVSAPMVRGGAVAFAIEVPGEISGGPADTDWEALRGAAQTAVRAVAGVTEVTAVLTGARPAAAASPAPSPAQPPAQPPAPAAPAPQAAPPPKPDMKPDMKDPAMLAGVDRVIAVASGKGGVGKSTSSVNLALALAARGLKVGLLDADIYGPSVPRMMGISDRPESLDGKRILPLKKYGLEVMSIGFMVDPETPMIWRGPMVMGALEQLMRDVAWGHAIGDPEKNPEPRLDIAIVDMPPGTGDVALTLSQRVELAGAVIVSTPQDIALIDAVKAIHMFRKVDVPILGIIENMSHFACPHCGETSEIFGEGGVAREAERLDCELIGTVPLDMDLRIAGDAGRPVVAVDPDHPQALIYSGIAEKIAGKLGL